MNAATFRLTLLALTLAASASAGEFRDQAKAKLPPSTYTFFAGEIKNKYPAHVRAYAIAEARVTRITPDVYCPKRGPGCGPNPSCNHNKVTVQALDLRIERVLFSTATVAWPEEYLRFPAYKQGHFKEGDRLQISLYAYRTESTGVSKLRKLPGAGPPKAKP